MTEVKITDAINTAVNTNVKQSPRSRKRLVLPLAILIIVAALAIYFLISYTSPIVAAGDTVNVTYTGAFTNGTVFDSNIGKNPLQFTVGSGQLIKGFDNGVVGMHVNEQKTITIPASLAYGQINPALIVQVPISAFNNQTVTVGMGVATTANGRQQRGIVTAVNKTTATVNFNSPLAGQTLVFTIKVLKINKKLG